MRILIVDDSAMARESIKKAILSEYEDFIITEVEDGSECYKLFAKKWSDKKPYDIIFLDVEMEFNGLYTLTKIREMERFNAFPSTKIIMVTSSINPKDIFNSSKNNADGYLIKGDELRDKVLEEIRKLI